MLNSLRLLDFRCFDELAMDLAPEGQIFVGHNARGKTTLLEAVCVLLRLQSPRAKQFRQLIRNDNTSFGIAGSSHDADFRINGDRKKLELQINGRAISERQQYLSTTGLVVWMGNEDLELIRGGGEARRRFLDFTANQVDSEYRHHWGRYRRALAARNRLLKTLDVGDGQVRAYTSLLIEHGQELISRREALCQNLRPRAAGIQQSISGVNEALELKYVDRSKGNLEEAFERVTESENRRGVTMAGPHRDELTINLNDRLARDYGSEGQQRTIALALKLSQGELLRSHGGKSPIYLIDDVFGELDPDRRNHLMQHLPPNAQKLITTTNLDWYRESELNLEVRKI